MFLVLQAAFLDWQFLDLLPFLQDRLDSAKSHIGRHGVKALLVSLVVGAILPNPTFANL